MVKSQTTTQIHIKKLVLSGMLVALTIALSGLYIPIGASKCFPIQHLINILAGVYLGPFYGISMAFCTSLNQNLMGTGSLLAFPGSMIGAFLGAWLFKKTSWKQPLLPRLLLDYVERTQKKKQLTSPSEPVAFTAFF